MRENSEIVLFNVNASSSQMINLTNERRLEVRDAYSGLPSAILGAIFRVIQGMTESLSAVYSVFLVATHLAPSTRNEWNYVPILVVGATGGMMEIVNLNNPKSRLYHLFEENREACLLFAVGGITAENIYASFCNDQVSPAIGITIGSVTTASLMAMRLGVEASHHRPLMRTKPGQYLVASIEAFYSCAIGVGVADLVFSEVTAFTGTVLNPYFKYLLEGMIGLLTCYADHKLEGKQRDLLFFAMLFYFSSIVGTEVAAVLSTLILDMLSNLNNSTEISDTAFGCIMGGSGFFGITSAFHKAKNVLNKGHERKQMHLNSHHDGSHEQQASGHCQTGTLSQFFTQCYRRLPKPKLPKLNWNLCVGRETDSDEEAAILSDNSLRIADTEL